jgi:hypothetical protein
VARNPEVRQGDGVSRSRAAVACLLAFVACTASAIVVSGGRPGTGQGIAPLALQGAGYLCVLVAALLLLAPRGTDRDASSRGNRRIGGVLLGSVALLVALDVVTLSDGPGANIGAGLARLVLLVVIVGATVRLRAIPTRSP